MFVPDKQIKRRVIKSYSLLGQLLNYEENEVTIRSLIGRGMHVQLNSIPCLWLAPGRNTTSSTSCARSRGDQGGGGLGTANKEGGLFKM